MKNYDVIVIGGGGGTKIISPAARLGLKVACIEKEALGGTCLNRGCIPSKMLIHPADVATQIKHAGKFDLQTGPTLKTDFFSLTARITRTVQADSRSIVQAYTEHSNIDYYHGQAQFKNNKVVRVGKETLTADKIFIAVGSRPSIPDIPGLKETPFMTSTEGLRRETLPNRMIIIGGGYIAAEMGHAYGALGCEVHLMVRSRLLRKEDRQVSDEFTRIFSREYNVHHGVTFEKVEYCDNKFTLFYSQRGETKTLEADALLVATGVVPNTDTLNLENTEISRDENNYIVTDDHLQTAVDGVFAFGDCIGRYLFRHSVNFEGEYLFRTKILQKNIGPIQYPPMPHAVFSYPQVAAVGKTEEELKNKGIRYVVGLNPYAKSAMGMALLSDYGFVKILIDYHTKEILGAHIVGEEASVMIHMLIVLMTKKGTLDDLLQMIYIHPALPEIIRNAARKAQAAFNDS